MTDIAFRAEATSSAPLTDLQLSYIVGREAPLLGGTGCSLCWEYERDECDVARMEEAWNALVARHETLRCTYAGGTMRVLEDVPRFRAEVHDLCGAGDGAEEALRQVRDEIQHASFDPSRWPLFRVAVVVMPHSVRLLFKFDLLIADAPAAFLLLREFGVLYDDPAATLPPVAARFAEFLAALQERTKSDSYRRAAAYWTARLDSIPPAPELPTTGAEISRSRFRRYEQHLSAGEWVALQERARTRGVRRVHAIAAAFSEVMARWSSRRDFTLNVTVGTRKPPQFAGVVGDFSSNLLLTVDCGASMTFEARAKTIGAQLARDLEHFEFSGVAVLSALSRARGERVTMPVVFTSLLHPDTGFSAMGRFVRGITLTPQVTLDCQMLETGSGLCLSWDVVEGFYHDDAVAAAFEAWVSFVKRLAASDAAWDEEWHDLLPAEQRRRREAANATFAAWPPETLHGRVLEQALATPERVAVIAADRVLTYRGLIDRAAALALRIREAGARPNELVAIVLPKGSEQVSAALAVQMAGAAYLPIDADAPEARVAELTGLGQCRLAVAREGVVLPRDVARIEPRDECSATWDAGPAAPDDLAYVIFTSGSTGAPKGVMIRHAAAANTVRDINSRFDVGPDDRVLALSALNFDLSVWDIFGTLSRGGAIVIPSPESGRDPAHLARLVEEHRVTIWNSVPSYLQMLAEQGPDPSRLASLRLAMLSGDWIPTSLPGRLPVPIVSLGGATEASIWSIAYPIDGVDPGWKSIPYGKPLANQRFHILDERLEDRPDGVSGELYIGGLGLADGYWREPIQTAASFIEHPRTGERLYRTGDWGRYLPDGNIEFLGRRDGQVKITGFRIEIGEIEAVLLRCDGVRETVVVTFTDDHEQKRLCAFYTGGAAVRDVRAHLLSQLPAYMVPSRFIMLEALPLSANGKVDRKALAGIAAAPDPDESVLGRIFNAPGVLRDADARRAHAAAAKAIRNDFGDSPRVVLAGGDDLAARAAGWTSVRDFTGIARRAQLESLLGGLRTFNDGGRTRRAYPSAGETCSVQTYVHIRPGRVEGVAGGIYYHHPVAHQLIEVAPPAAIDTRIHVPANQRMAEEAAFWIVFIADLAAIRPMYGELAEPFAWMEAGHMAQILRQTAADCGLGLCLIGAFDVVPLRRALGLSEDHIAVGSMAGGMPGAFVLDSVAGAAVQRLDVARTDARVEQVLSGIWRDVLNVSDVGRDDRFFEIGGTSFTMLTVQREIESRLGRKVSITDLFRHGTIAELASHLSAAAAAPPPPVQPAAGAPALADDPRDRRQLRRRLRSEGVS